MTSAVLAFFFVRRPHNLNDIRHAAS